MITQTLASSLVPLFLGTGRRATRFAGEEKEGPEVFVHVLDFHRIP